MATRFGLVPHESPPATLTAGSDRRWRMITCIGRLGGLLSTAIDAGAIDAHDDAAEIVTDIW